MSEQENLRIVKEAYAAFGRGDIPALLNLLADDVVWFTPGPRDVIPFAGERRGRKQVEGFFRSLDQHEEVENFEAQDFIAQGDKVAAFGTYRGRVKSTGRTGETDWAHVHTLRNGKIVRFKEYLDTAAAVAAYRPAAKGSQAT